MNPLNNLDGLGYSPEDLKRKFQGAWFLFHDSKANKTFVDQVHSVNGDGWWLAVNERINVDDVSIIKEMPHAGVFTYDTGVAMVERLPYRQFKRGIHRESVRVTDLYGTELPIRQSLVKAILLPKTTSLKNGLKQLAANPDRRAIAVGRDHRYWLRADDGVISVFLKRIRVGVYMGDRFWKDSSASSVEVELHDDLELV